MFQLLYILAFSFLAFVAVSNLVRNLLTFGNEARKPVRGTPTAKPKPLPHPEMLDDSGRVSQEPLLVMRSIGMDDVRDRLDAIYDSSPGSKPSNPNGIDEDDDERPPLASR